MRALGKRVRRAQKNTEKASIRKGGIEYRGISHKCLMGDQYGKTLATPRRV